MIKLGKHISELLYSHDSVIVPGFGIFSTKYVPARFIPEEKIVESPRKIVDFRPEPKQGDTPLIAYMAKKEGKDHGEVLQSITNTIKDVEHALEAGNKVEFERIGTFFRDPDGSLQFEASRQVNYLEEDTGVKTVETPPQKIAEEVKKDEPFLTDSTTNEESTKPKTKEIMKEPSKKETKKEIKHTEKEKMDPALKWIAIVGIPLLLILIIVFWQFNYFFGEDGLFSKSEPVVVEAPVVTPVEPVEEEEVEIIPEPIPVEPEEPPFDPYAEPAKPDPFRPVYYIVVGSFSNERNATELALELRKDDARLAGVLEKTITDFHRVYYGWYYDLNEAKAEKQKLDPSLREIAWILHR